MIHPHLKMLTAQSKLEKGTQSHWDLQRNSLSAILGDIHHYDVSFYW